jgi:acetyltransferase AlgX (SGNH hydrolase-like protein)
MQATNRSVRSAARAPTAAGRALRIALAALCVVTLGWVVRRMLVPPTSACIVCLGSVSAVATGLLAAYLLLWAIYFTLSYSPARAKVANCLLATLAVTFIVGVLEIPAVLHLVDYRIVLSPRDSVLYTVKAWANPRNQLDPELLYLHRPHQRFTGTTLGDLVTTFGLPADHRYAVDIQYDGHGFRNNVDLTRASIIVVGDSFVESPLVPQNELLTTRLAEELGVPVANLGQIGYSPQQELIVLRRFGIGLQPKVAVWMFFEGNDLLDFERYARSIRKWPQESFEIHRFPNRSFTKNALIAFVGLVQQTPPAASYRQRTCRLPQRRDGESQTLYFGFGNGPPSGFGAGPLSSDDLNNLDGAEAVFREAHDLAEQHGIQLVFVYVPTKYRVYRDLCTFPADSYAAGWELNDLPKRLQSWNAAHDIPFVDLTPALQAAAARGDVVFFPDDGHWNAAGNAVGAETIAAFLRSPSVEPVVSPASIRQ